MANRVVDVITIDGGEHLKRLFDELPARVATKLSRRVLYAAALPIRDAARAGVPVKHGALKKAIIVRTGQELVDAGGGKRVRGGNLKVYVTIDPAAKFIMGVSRDRKTGKWSLKARRMRKGDFIQSKQAFLQPRQYAHLVEFGTRPHAFGKESELATRINSKRTGSGVQVGKQHPGARPKPFMRPAFDNNALKASGIMAQKTEELIGEEAATLARRQQRRKGGS